MLKDTKHLSLVFLQRGGTGVIVGDFSKSPYRFSFSWRLLQEGYRRRCASFCNFLSIVLIVDLWFRSLFVIPLGCGRGFYRATLRTPKVLVLFSYSLWLLLFMKNALLSTSENHLSCFPQKKEAACCVLWKQMLIFVP